MLGLRPPASEPIEDTHSGWQCEDPRRAGVSMTGRGERPLDDRSSRSAVQCEVQRTATQRNHVCVHSDSDQPEALVEDILERAEVARRVGAERDPPILETDLPQCANVSQPASALFANAWLRRLLPTGFCFKGRTNRWFWSGREIPRKVIAAGSSSVCTSCRLPHAQHK
jgi:hypothetical protein